MTAIFRHTTNPLLSVPRRAQPVSHDERHEKPHRDWELGVCTTMISIEGKLDYGVAQRVQAPRCQMIPIKTDVNVLLSLSSIPDKVPLIAATQSRRKIGNRCTIFYWCLGQTRKGQDSRQDQLLLLITSSVV